MTSFAPRQWAASPRVSPHAHQDLPHLDPYSIDSSLSIFCIRFANTQKKTQTYMLLKHTCTGLSGSRVHHTKCTRLGHQGLWALEPLISRSPVDLGRSRICLESLLCSADSPLLEETPMAHLSICTVLLSETRALVVQPMPGTAVQTSQQNSRSGLTTAGPFAHTEQNFRG